MKLEKRNLIKSPLNYTGGKYKLLSQIAPLFPENIDTFVDLFCGGCDVGVNIEANKIICNDILLEVIELMKEFQKHTPKEIMEYIDDIIYKYELSNTYVKSYEHYGCNSNDGLAKYNKEKFKKLREDYNKGKRTPIMFYTLVMYSFNNYIKIDDDGNFLNSSPNKRDFNKSLRGRIENFVNRIHNINIQFTNQDFREFNIESLTKEDFVYCDPPYLITNVTYTENWTEQEEKELLKFLDKLNDKNIKFALSNVLEHRGRTNDILYEWSKKYKVHYLDKDYQNCNYQVKNDKKSIEVLIVNY